MDRIHPVGHHSERLERPPASRRGLEPQELDAGDDRSERIAKLMGKDGDEIILRVGFGPYPRERILKRAELGIEEVRIHPPVFFQGNDDVEDRGDRYEEDYLNRRAPRSVPLVPAKAPMIAKSEVRRSARVTKRGRSLSAITKSGTSSR